MILQDRVALWISQPAFVKVCDREPDHADSSRPPNGCCSMMIALIITAVNESCRHLLPLLGRVMFFVVLQAVHILCDPS